MRWSSSCLQLCRRVRDPEQCSQMCHRHHSSQWGIPGRTIHSCLSRSGRRSWGLHSSTNSRCFATRQKRSPRLYMSRSTGLVTDISKNRKILPLCLRRHSIRTGKSGLQRQSPKTPWPRRVWPRSKSVRTWRRKTACKPKTGRFQQVAFPLGFGMLIRSTVGDQLRPIQQHKYVQRRVG